MKRLIFTAIFFLVSVFSFSQTEYSITDTIKYENRLVYSTLNVHATKPIYVISGVKRVINNGSTWKKVVKYNNDRSRCVIDNTEYEVYNIGNKTYYEYRPTYSDNVSWFYVYDKEYNALTRISVN